LLSDVPWAAISWPSACSIASTSVNTSSSVPASTASKRRASSSNRHDRNVRSCERPFRHALQEPQAGKRTTGSCWGNDADGRPSRGRHNHAHRRAAATATTYRAGATTAFPVDGSSGPADRGLPANEAAFALMKLASLDR